MGSYRLYQQITATPRKPLSASYTLIIFCLLVRWMGRILLNPRRPNISQYGHERALGRSIPAAPLLSNHSKGGSGRFQMIIIYIVRAVLSRSMLESVVSGATISATRTALIVSDEVRRGWEVWSRSRSDAVRQSMCSRMAFISACMAAILSPKSLLVGLGLTPALSPPPAASRFFLLYSLPLLATCSRQRPVLRLT